MKAWGKRTRANTRAMKLQLAALTDEVAELRAWRDSVVTTAPSGAPVAP